MDSGYVLKQENPQNRAGIFSKLFFIWMIKLCNKATKNYLEINDLYKTATHNQSQPLTNSLEKNWDEEVIRAKSKLKQCPSLIKAIAKTFYRRYMCVGFFLFIEMGILRPMQPMVLAYFIDSFTQDNYQQTYILGTILVVQSLVVVLFSHHLEFLQTAVGMRIRIAVSSLIYRKMLKLSKAALEQVEAGKVVNLLSNDVNRFDFVTIALHHLWIMPLQVVLITYLIWREVGVSAFAGVLLMMGLIIPLQGYLGKLTSKFRLKTAQRTDDRIKLMNEVITGVQIIKMYAWEKAFAAAIKLARKLEIKIVSYSAYLRGIHLSCIVFMERLTLFATILCYVLLGNNLRADKVFSMAQFFNLLQLAIAIYYPMAIIYGAETLISLKRLRDFLLLEEIQQGPVQRTSDQSVVISNVDAGWSSKQILQNLNLVVPPKTLCAIVGPVGSGKSSILQLLLGELVSSSGSVRIGGSVSYCSQEAWLFAASVRNNILFGRQYDKKRYREVVDVCCLVRDFELLPQGDKTIVGERGVSLSGGQRARINLARAIYVQADIYLFDDPLSAVDTHVGKYLFQECIMKYLDDKTRVLVTHQLQFLKKAHHIVVVENGTAEAQGSFNDIIKSNSSLTLSLSADSDEEVEEQLSASNELKRKESVLSRQSVTSDKSGSYKTVDQEEEMSSQNVSPFKSYLSASGNKCSIVIVSFLFILAQVANTAADLWVAIWTQQESLRTDINTSFVLLNRTENDLYEKTTYETDTGHFTRTLLRRDISLYIYSGIVGTAVVLTLLRSFGYFKMAMTASKNLHNQIFEALIHAPLRFFNTNPSGRILNRFSKDMGAVDEILPRVMIEAIQILLVMSGILASVALANYYMIAVMALFAIFFVKLRGWYVSIAKCIKHLEGITKSNVFSHLNSSLSGITTIRASKAEEVLGRQFDVHQDTHTSAWFLTIATRVGFGLWLDLLSVLFVAAVIYSFIILSQYATVEESLIGLAVSQALILTGMLQIGMRQTGEVVNQLTSVERILQYTKLENEYDESVVDVDDWPSKGAIHFRDMSLRYSVDDAPVLHHITLEINAGDKIGIVGRTGAGKSSLISALFRLATTDGSVLIDGVDTKTVPLDKLRKNISIIPQEPILFSGTLRYNLDPFNEFGDKALWDVLQEIELKDKIDGLQSVVSEGGSNFSVGQKQLLCLGRAILRNNKILVMDEATANVDQRTDSLIQNTIRAKFRDCTVLTIAHRLNTIMDSDKIIVVDAGRVVEFDKPHVLLGDTYGYFTKMVAETGNGMAQQLKQIAQDTHELQKLQE